MFTCGLLRSKTAYDRARFKTGDRVWRWRLRRGLEDRKPDRAVRRKGAIALKAAGILRNWVGRKGDRKERAEVWLQEREKKYTTKLSP